MRREAAIWMTCFTIITAGGCVSQSRYDKAVEELDQIKKELTITRAEEQALTQEVKILEERNRTVMNDVDLTVVAAQQAKSEADRERRAADEQLVKLKRSITQLAAQLRAIRRSLEVEKDDTPALQEVADVYMQKMAASSEPSVTPAPPPVAAAPAPAAPEPPPPPQAAQAPAPAPAQPATPAATPPSPQPAPQAAPAAEPAEAGWLSAIKEWVVSLWRSVFS